jgi:hypothetical protein
MSKESASRTLAATTDFTENAEASHLLRCAERVQR